MPFIELCWKSFRLCRSSVCRGCVDDCLLPNYPTQGRTNGRWRKILCLSRSELVIVMVAAKLSCAIWNAPAGLRTVVRRPLNCMMPTTDPIPWENISRKTYFFKRTSSLSKYWATAPFTSLWNERTVTCCFWALSSTLLRSLFCRTCHYISFFIRAM